MSDTNPLDTSNEEYQERIRLRAYLLWEEDGRPEGRAGEYWERARFLIGIEDNPDAGTMPPEAKHEVIDEAEIEENLGEFPDRLTDQGDRLETPRVRRSRT
jgi:hypothetical protein